MMADTLSQSSLVKDHPIVKPKYIDVLKHAEKYLEKARHLEHPFHLPFCIEVCKQRLSEAENEKKKKLYDQVHGETMDSLIAAFLKIIKQLEEIRDVKDCDLDKFMKEMEENMSEDDDDSTDEFSATDED